MRYRFTFSARRKGALGIWRQFVAERTARTQQEAELGLYDEYEHISIGKVEVLPEVAP